MGKCTSAGGQVTHTTNPKPSHVATAGMIVIPPVTGIDIASTVARDIATAFATVVANAVTNDVASAIATDIFTGITDAIDIPVETVGAIVIVSIIATALDTVVVAIVEPRVRFPAGAPSGYVTHCQLLYSARGTFLCAPVQVYDVSPCLPGTAPLWFSL